MRGESKFMTGLTEHGKRDSKLVPIINPKKHRHTISQDGKLGNVSKFRENNFKLLHEHMKLV